jgi:hypothetical protein
MAQKDQFSQAQLVWGWGLVVVIVVMWMEGNYFEMMVCIIDKLLVVWVELDRL